MKIDLRAVLASVLVLLIPTLVSAAPLTWGVKAGIGSSNLSPSELAGGLLVTQSKLAPSGGVFGAWGLNPYFSMQAEVLYASKGFSYGESEATDMTGNSIGTFETISELEVIEIPLLLHATWPTQGRFRPGAVVGPSLWFKLREQMKTTGAVEGSEESDEYSSNGWGITAGGELRMRTGPGWSLIEARYTSGTTDLSKRFGGDEQDRSWTVMLGYEF